MKRLAGFFTLLIGLAAVVAAWWWLGQERDDVGADFASQPYVVPVTLTTVEISEVRPSVSLTGTVRSLRWASLAFEVSGTLSEISVRKAEPVRQGQLLARLVHDDQALELARTEADVTVAQMNLARLAAGERSEVIARLTAEQDAAAADEELANREVERNLALAESDDVSRAQLDRTLASQKGAKARRSAAAERLAEAQAGTRSEDLDIAAAQVRAAEARRDQAQRAQDKTQLFAPWDGTITRRFRSVGDVLAPGAPLFQLADLLNLEIEVEVPAEYALRLGQSPPVRLTVDEAPDFSLSATLDATVPTADSVSRNFVGLIRLTADAKTQAVLHPGMFVRIELDLTPVNGAPVVHSDAVRITDKGPILAVAEAANPDDPSAMQARFVPIRVLASNNGLSAVEPLAGELPAGTQVVLVGVDSTYPGVPLRPRAPSADNGNANE